MALRHSLGPVPSVLAAILLCVTTSANALPDNLPSQPVREEICLNGIWDFKLGDDAWSEIPVPSTWGGGSFYGMADCFGLYRPGKSETDLVGTYRKRLTVPGSMDDRIVRFACNASLFFTTVKVNDREVGTNNEGQTPFEFIINSALTGGEETIEVMVENKRGYESSMWSASRRGMWQDVYLRSYPKLFVENHFFVNPSYRKKSITCLVPVRNEDTKERTFHVRNYVTGPDGAVVKIFDGDGPRSVGPGEMDTVWCTSSWPDAHLWFPHDPYLYHIHTVLYDTDETTVIDWKKTRFGFREVYVEGRNLMFNGRRCKLTGDSHHYYGEYMQTRQYAINIIKEWKKDGIRYYRPHLQPYDPVWLDVADSLGFLIDNETAICIQSRGPKLQNPKDRDAVLSNEMIQFYREHTAKLIERDRNHPCVITWSTGNETGTNGIPEWPFVEKCNEMDSSLICHSNGHWSEWDISTTHYSWQAKAPGVYYGYGSTRADSTMVPNKNSELPHYGGEMGSMWTGGWVDSGSTRSSRKAVDAPGPVGYEMYAENHSIEWYFGREMFWKCLAMQRDEYYAMWSIFGVWHDFWRWQPFFFEEPGVSRRDGYLYTWPDRTAPGLKPQRIKPFTNTVNYLDPELPAVNPKVSYHMITDIIREVHCSDSWKYLNGLTGEQDYNYSSGEQFSRRFDLHYFALRPADRMRCEIVRADDGSVLWSNDVTSSPFHDLVPGTIYEDLTASWEAPTVNEVTPVIIRRSFHDGAARVYNCDVPGKIFPAFSATHIPDAANRAIAVYDKEGSVFEMLVFTMGLGVNNLDLDPNGSLSNLSYPETEILVIGKNSPTEGKVPASFVRDGGRILCLEQSADPGLVVPDYTLVEPDSVDPQFLVHGARHRIFKNLNQNDFSHWSGGVKRADKVFARPAGHMARVLLGGNNEGDYAPIVEYPSGKGLYLCSQLNLCDNFEKEPVTGQLLCNMLNYLGGYTPADKAKTGLIAGTGDMKSFCDGLGLYYEQLDPGALPDLSSFSLLLVDGSSSSAASAGNEAALSAFVNGGGRVLVWGLTGANAAAFNKLFPHQVTVQPADAGAEKRAVKCALTWRRHDTGDILTRYGCINIPYPFEYNPDPLLLGLNNKDLYWDGTRIADNGLRYSGTYRSTYPDIVPLAALRDEDYHHSGGWAHLGPDAAQKWNTWLRDRQSVLLRLNEGEGCWVINQMNLHQGGDKGKRIASLLLTSLGATLGDTPTYYNTHYSVALPQQEYPVRKIKPGIVHRTPRRLIQKVCNGRVEFPSHWRGKAVRMMIFDVRGRLVRQVDIPRARRMVDVARDFNAARGALYVVKASMTGRK